MKCCFQYDINTIELQIKEIFPNKKKSIKRKNI